MLWEWYGSFIPLRHLYSCHRQPFALHSWQQKTINSKMLFCPFLGTLHRADVYLNFNQLKIVSESSDAVTCDS